MTGVGGLDDRQSRVADLLDAHSLRLAGVYRSAWRALATPPESGCEAARVLIICHCMRELMNGIPSAVGDGASPRPNPSSQSLAAGLPRLLAAHPDVDLDADQDLIPVKREVAAAFSRLVKTAQLEEGRNQRELAGFLTGDTSQRHAAGKQWNAARAFFLEWTHLDRNHEGGRELPTDEMLRQHIRVIEDIVEARTLAFFETIRSIDDLLAEINAEVPEGVEE